jgi:membrane-associated phospholipid phosphatase
MRARHSWALAVVLILSITTPALVYGQGAEAPPPEQAEILPPPPPEGFKSFIKTTADDFVAFPKRKSTWVILGVGAASALLASPADDTANARISGSSDLGRFFAPGRWVGSQWVQIGAAAGLYLGGRQFGSKEIEGQPNTNKVAHLGYDLLRAQLLSQAYVHGIKQAVRRDRPTGECCAFPSGHAAGAFAAAAVIERHFGYRAAWPTLAVATYVGVSRLHDNRHVLSDVLFGSAIGMATGWTVVGRHGRNEYALVPTPVRGGMAISLVRTQD